MLQWYNSQGAIETILSLSLKEHEESDNGTMVQCSQCTIEANFVTLSERGQRMRQWYNPQGTIETILSLSLKEDEECHNGAFSNYKPPTSSKNSPLENHN